jgi:hypothetical protein
MLFWSASLRIVLASCTATACSIPCKSTITASNAFVSFLHFPQLVLRRRRMHSVHFHWNLSIILVWTLLSI